MGTKYSTTSVSGYDSSPPSDDGTVSEANKVKWSTIKTKLSDPLNTAIGSIDTKLENWADVASITKSSSYTTTADDDGRTIECTGTFQVTLGNPPTMGSGYSVTIKNVSTGTITVSGTIDGSSGDTLEDYEGATYCVNNAESGYTKNSNTGITADSTSTLTNKTLTSPTITTPTITSPVINTGVSGSAIDTDTGLSADSDTLLASQKAVKAYIATVVAMSTDYSDATNCTMTLPNGIIIKWGYESVSTGDTNVSFATAFPNAIYAAYSADVKLSTSGGSDTVSVHNVFPTTSGLSFSTPSGIDRIYWLAIGR